MNNKRQQGIALATALIFLVVITLLGLVAVRSSTTEMRLAHNEQTRIEAMENAQAIIDAVIADDSNTPITLDPDYMRCFDSGDAGTQIQCPSGHAGLSIQPKTTDEASDPGLFDDGVYAEVRRLEPAQAPMPGRLMTSMDKFSVASFSVRGQYSRAQIGLGSADIEEGLLKLMPNNERIE